MVVVVVGDRHSMVIKYTADTVEEQRAKDPLEQAFRDQGLLQHAYDRETHKAATKQAKEVEQRVVEGGAQMTGKVAAEQKKLANKSAATLGADGLRRVMKGIREQRSEIRGQKSESREQKPESGEQIVEGREDAGLGVEKSLVSVLASVVARLEVSEEIEQSMSCDVKAFPLEDRGGEEGPSLGAAQEGLEALVAELDMMAVDVCEADTVSVPEVTPDERVEFDIEPQR